MNTKQLSIFISITTLSFLSCKNQEELPDIETSFSANTQEVLVGQTVSFTDESNGKPDKWEWKFEGGTPSQSTEQNPIITYDNEGKYNVTLISSNQSHSMEVEKTEYIEVFVKLNPLFDVADTTINQGSEIVFNNLSEGTNPIWEWEFEGGTPFTSSNESPTVVYSTPGIYTATLNISNTFETTGVSKTIKVVVLPTDGLVAYFPFNGNANDESGNNLNGNIFEATLTTDRNGTSDQAYHFDGINDRIEITNNLLFELQAYTLSTWVKLENETGAIISLTNFSPVKNNCGYYLSVVNGNIRGFSNISTSNWAKNIDSDILSNNEWHHIVFSFDGQLLSLYLDGLLISTIQQQHSANYSEHNPLQIGTYATQSGATAFNGDIDAVRIFNRSLTGNEVLVLFNE